MVMVPSAQQLGGLRNTEDIPVERDSVGAMGLATVARTFKPYVYRGWGVDLLELPPVRPVPKREAPPRKRRVPLSRPVRPPGLRSPTPEEREDHRVAVATALRAQRMLELAELELTQLEYLRGLDTEPEPEPEPKPEPKPKPKPKPKLKRTGPIRPSTGWKPTSGADIDAMLALYDA